MNPAAGDHQPPRYYGLAFIRHSFVHFVFGKGLSAASSLVVLVIVIRNLAVAEFAVYASMHALVLMLGILSSLGVNAVLLRFLPELRAAHNNRAMYRLMAIGMALRMMLYAVAALMLLPFADTVGALLKMEEWARFLPLYLIVGFLRVNATFAIWVLESLLWQKEAQYSLAVAYVFKLAMVLAVVWNGTLSLETFVLIECGVELLSLVLLLSSALLRRVRDVYKSTGDAGILRRDWRRYARFALWSYAQNLTSIFHGSAPNRLLIGYFMPVGAIALFGTVDRLITYIQRYEPLLIFLGMVRPIFNSRFARPGDFPKLVFLANLLFRLNLVVLLVPFILFAMAGKPLFDWLTAGKYVEAASIFLAFYVVVILNSANSMIDVLVKVVERNRIYTFTNLVLSASIGLAVPLIPHIGLWALVLANAVGTILAVSIILTYLRRVGYGIAIDWSLIFRILTATAASVGLGHALLGAGVPLIASIALSYAGCALALFFWPAFRADEKSLILKVVWSGSARTSSKVSIGAEFEEGSRTYGK